MKNWQCCRCGLTLPPEANSRMEDGGFICIPCSARAKWPAYNSAHEGSKECTNCRRGKVAAVSQWDCIAMAALLTWFAIDDDITGHPIRAAVSAAFAVLNIAAAVWRGRDEAR